MSRTNSIFFTARGKDFCKELLQDGQVQILAYTRYKEMIRVSARAVPVAETEQKNYIDLIFQEQPYLENVYPGKTREIGIVFVIRDMQIEYFNLGVNPIFREQYLVGNGVSKPKGYEITSHCIGCGTCVNGCPQRCIKPGTPYSITQTYENRELIERMIKEQKDMRIPSALIPRCPQCGKPMTMNLRSDNCFVEDEGWKKAASRYEDFLRRHKNLHIKSISGASTTPFVKPSFAMPPSGKSYGCGRNGNGKFPLTI